MKNIIFNGLYSDLASGILSRIAQHYSLDSVVTVGFRERIQVPDPVIGKNCRYTELEYWKIVHGEYPESKTAYLDAEILDLVKSDWFILLKMFDRLAPELVYSFEDRMRMAFAHIRYWNDVLEQNKVDLFLAMNYPHEIFDYVIYLLCKAKGIRVLFLAETRVNGYFHIIEEIEKADPTMALPDHFKPSKADDVQLSPMMQKHWEEQTKEFKVPFYMVVNEQRRNAENAWSAVLKKVWTKIKIRTIRVVQKRHLTLERIIKILYFRFKFGPEAQKKLFSYYQERTRGVDLTKKYVFVPLHFQPECTTSPQGSYFAYQELLIELLAKALPEDVLLYVKEHPEQKIHGRAIEFYETILKHPRVTLIPTHLKTLDFVKSCTAVATIVGTVGWEGLFLNKPTLLFGQVFFQYAPNVYPIKSFADVQSAWKLIQEKAGTDFLPAMKGFLKHVETRAHRGWIDMFYREESGLDDETNLNGIVQALVDRIDRKS